MTTLNLMSVEKFDNAGGLNIGVGEGNKLYTLRSDYHDFVRSSEGPVKVRRSHHLRNLGKDWNEVVERLPGILAGLSLSNEVYVPGYVSGVLDPNRPPVPVVIPDTFPNGKYVGLTIEEVKARDLDYALWYATRMWVSVSNKVVYGFVAKVQEAVASELDAIKAQEADEEKKRLEEKAERAVVFGPLADVLKRSWAYGYWKEDIDSFGNGETPSRYLIGRWEEAYGKVFGRANSKKYKAAVETFLAALAPYRDE